MTVKKSAKLILITSAVWFASTGIAAADTTLSPALTRALDELRASAAVWRDNDAEFRSIRRAKELADTETIEFAQYVAELKRQVLEDCKNVRELGGERLLEQFDCQLPKSEPAPLAALRSQPEDHKTEEEKIQSLDDKLRKLEGEIDVVVRTATQANAYNEKREDSNDNVARFAGTVQPSNNPSGASQVSSGTRGVTAGGAGTNANRNDVASTPAGPLNNQSGTGTKVFSSSARTGTPPKADPGAGPGMERQGTRSLAEPVSAPNGNDDDVIAAQLREAAEREKDKVLREKLWSEYRKYKASMH